MIPKSFLLLATLAFLAFPASAQEIKVDFNMTGRQWTEGTDPSYTPWSTNYTWFTGGDVVSNTFSGVTVIFTRVGPEGTSLMADWYKAGIQDTLHNSKLVNDGISVSPHNTGGNGGQIELRIRGLSAGPHTLLSFHNTWQNPANYTFSPIRVSVDGVLVITNLPVSNRVTNNADATSVYLEFAAVDGQDVVILYQAETNNSATDKNVCIDGFELDTANSTLKAVKPVPADRDEHVDADSHSLSLSWNAAGSAVLHDVYFGTDSNTVKTATHASPAFKGNQAATNCPATNLNSLLTYFWRIDEVNATNGVTKGDLWQFRPRHLAFPGAEGYGRFARGGRGGVVVEVTNTNDSGAGSLRDALTGNYGPRTVVFTVSGLITLESDLIINQYNPYITLAGQTAPGKGICVRKHQLGLSGAKDVTVRHIRSRPGNISGTTLNGSGMAGVDHCIMDHCSISWGIDEEMSTRNAKNVTMQRTLISEALNIAGHDKYPPGTKHGYAATVGGDIASLHHNLLAHCEGRNWSLGGGLDANGYFAGRLDIFNNVVYNWGGRTTDGGAHEVNFVNNYYKPGEAMNENKILIAQYENFPGTQQYYFIGNVMPGYYQTNQQENARTYTGTPNGYSPWVDAPFFPSYATVDEVTNACKQVLSDVGCNQPQIDDHDVRVIRETIDGTYTYTGSISGVPGLPDSQTDVGGWDNYPALTRRTDWDTDHDGLPTWWEQIKGLNPNSAPGDFSDSNGDPDGDEYTNLEDYLNWLAVPHFDCTNGTPLDVDLGRFTRGFTNNTPVFTAFNATNGTVMLVAGTTARFTSTVSTNALGNFTFSVVDAQGYSMTGTVGLRIIAAATPQAPILGIRNEGGALQLELTGETGSSFTVQSKTNLSGAWLDWTNVTGSSAMQLLPLDGLTNQSPRFFRAFAQ
jgi:hypothetical protein